MTEAKDEYNLSNDMFSQVINFMFTQVPAKFSQMSANKEMKIFGERAVAALLKEHQQLHNKSVFECIESKVLTANVRRRAL
mmetsp:Transcript_9094/g.12929  ORF Transcript_9094/g.12929 Transcript_9094/m.12929 type:complete len:81 (-) Transcript_9094:1766-2008(-)